MEYLDIEYGNAGSRTHRYGTVAQKAVNRAREQVAAVVGCAPEEVIFTSGATESNNLAILGLAEGAERAGKRHIVTTAVEHKAILEPVDYLRARGFEITLVPPSRDGRVSADDVVSAVRPDTLLVSVMHVNNETGVIQPIDEVAEGLSDSGSFFHVDAAQGFGKDLDRLKHPRIDLVSMSGHKIYGPKGIGALISRRQKGRRIPLVPRQFGGGQERGLRAGTIAVPLAAALGHAAQLAVADFEQRTSYCLRFRDQLIASLESLNPELIGERAGLVPNILSIRFQGLDAEAVILALKDHVAISTGSACTSNRHEVSHVTRSMGFSSDESSEVTRWSWCHLTPEPDWALLPGILRQLA